MLHPHLASTMPTPDDPLQQRGTLAGYASTSVPLPVLAHLFPSLHVLLPTHIGWMMRKYQHRPLGLGAQVGPRFAGLGRALLTPVLPPTISIRPCIGRILQDTHDGT